MHPDTHLPIPERPRFYEPLLATVALVVGAALLAFALAGCSSTAKSEREVINEGNALVRGWEPDGPVRAEKKKQFLEDAAPYVTPSPSPSPAVADANTSRAGK
jgi:hypothetical protein